MAGTEPELIARWLMPNDFKLESGHAFTFRGFPVPAAAFGGTGYCEVLGFDPANPCQAAGRRLMSGGWRGRSRQDHPGDHAAMA